MKFEINRQDFHKAIHTVESIISAREIRSVVSSILIEATADELILTATDLEIGIKTTLAVSGAVAGKITLPAKKLSQSIREFRGEKIEFESNAEHHITIKDPSGQSRAVITLMGASSDEYPQIPTLAAKDYITFPVSIMQDMIRHTSYSMAEEDARYVFNGLFLQNSGKGVDIVATDGRRLSRVKRDFPEELPFKDGIILPNKAVRELQKLLDPENEGQIAFDKKDRRVYFRLGNVDLITKLIEGQFPDYNQVIPKSLESIVEVDHSSLEHSIRQVAVMAAEPTRQVRLIFSPGNLTIEAATPDIGEARDTLPIDYEGEELTIAFNSNYIIDVVKIVKTEKLKLGFSSSNAPAVIQDPDDADFTAVIMPMKL